MFPSIATTIADIQRESQTQKRKRANHRDPKWDRTYEAKRKKLKTRGHAVNLFKDQKPLLDPLLFKDIHRWVVSYERDRETASQIRKRFFGNLTMEPLEEQSGLRYSDSVDCMLRVLLYLQEEDASSGGRGGYVRLTKEALKAAQLKHKMWFTEHVSTNDGSKYLEDNGRQSAVSTKNGDTTSKSHTLNSASQSQQTTNGITNFSAPKVTSNNHPRESETNLSNSLPFQPHPPTPPTLPNIQNSRPPMSIRVKKRGSSNWRVWFQTPVFVRFHACKTMFAPPDTTAPEFVEMLLALVRCGKGRIGGEGSERMEWDRGLLEWAGEPYRFWSGEKKRGTEESVEDELDVESDGTEATALALDDDDLEPQERVSVRDGVGVVDASKPPQPVSSKTKSNQDLLQPPLFRKTVSYIPGAFK
ncbi:hypothetical protein HDV05_000716 [Chytridiales sp. JEL 0842]|nr:hypothetical protein HDV05_000716 [Chytridiales sp. JEL 0842]